jgi:hypothetical protein
MKVFGSTFMPNKKLRNFSIFIRKKSFGKRVLEKEFWKKSFGKRTLFLLLFFQALILSP